MATSGTFGAVGVSAVESTQSDGDVSVTLSGAAVADVYLEFSRDGTGWHPFSRKYGPLDLSDTLRVRAGRFIRLRCTAYTSGTVTYSFQLPTGVQNISLPTDPTGLPTGAFYNNGGVLSIA